MAVNPSISVVSPEGVECQRIYSHLPDSVVLNYCAKSSIGDGEAVAVDANKVMQGSLYQNVIKSEAQSYLAILSLYLGKSELPFLPSNTQAWITLIGEKLDATIAKNVKNLPLAVQD